MKIFIITLSFIFGMFFFTGAIQDLTQIKKGKIEQKTLTLSLDSLNVRISIITTELKRIEQDKKKAEKFVSESEKEISRLTTVLNILQAIKTDTTIQVRK